MKYKVSKSLILESGKKRTGQMAIDIKTVVPFSAFISNIFNSLFDLRLCAIEPVRQNHKTNGGR
jgi:hypothetical protein